MSFKALRVEGLLIRGIFPPIASFLKLGHWVTEGSIQPTSTLSFPTVEPLIVETKSSRKYKITNSREILGLKNLRCVNKFWRNLILYHMEDHDTYLRHLSCFILLCSLVFCLKLKCPLLKSFLQCAPKKNVKAVLLIK